MTIYCYFMAYAFITALITGGAFMAYKSGEKELNNRYNMGRNNNDIKRKI